MTLHERLELSADPIAARMLIESERRRPHRGRRRISARLVPPGSSYERWLADNGFAGIDRQIENAFGRERS